MVVSCSLPVVLLFVLAPAQAGPICGPGGHRVDVCTPAGVNTFPADLTIGLHVPGLGSQIFSATVPVVTYRGMPVAGGGDPTHLNQIPIELASMSLMQASPLWGATDFSFGDGVANLAYDGPLHSSGLITEQAGDPSLADSFFDVFVEVRLLDLGMTFCNQNAMRISGVIATYPHSGAVHTLSPVPAPLVKLPGCDSDPGSDPPPSAFVTQLTWRPLTRIEIPEPSSLVLAGAGVLLWWAVRRR